MNNLLYFTVTPILSLPVSSETKHRYHTILAEGFQFLFQNCNFTLVLFTSLFSTKSLNNYPIFFIMPYSDIAIFYPLILRATSFPS